jgi:hypothetical protein
MEQDKSGNFSDVWDIISHYRARKGREEVINHVVEERVFKRLANIPPEQRSQVIDWLLENHPKNFGLDLIAINNAVAHAKGYTTQYIVALKVRCECCGLEYQYKEYVTDEENILKNIFDRCPQCGFRYKNTLDDKDYIRRTGKTSETYLRELDVCKKNWIARGKKWQYNRDEDIRWMRAHKEKNTEYSRIIAAIDAGAIR